MGLNEFAGYIALAAITFLTGWIASNYGLRPYPFYNDLDKFFFLVYCSLFHTWNWNGYCLSDISRSNIRLYPSRPTTEEYWYFQTVERFRICHWRHINWLNCRSVRIGCPYSCHWIIDGCFFLDC